MSSLKQALRTGARAIGISRPVPPKPIVGYVVAVPAAPFVKIDHGPDSIELIARAKFHDPAVTPGYILALQAGAEAMVAALPMGNLAERRQHNGWYEATLEEAMAAIDAAAKAYSRTPIIHTDRPAYRAWQPTPRKPGNERRLQDRRAAGRHRQYGR